MNLRNLKSKSRAELGKWAARAHWRLVDRPQPSFAHRYAVQRQVYFSALLESGLRRGSLWEWETKEGHRAIAEKLGLATPRILSGPVPVEALTFDGLPESFVVKPVIGGSANGVFVLRRAGQGYVDLLNGGAIISQAGIKNQLRELDAAGLISGDAVLVEEALLFGHTPVHDWKVYSFQGETPLVWQIERSMEVRRSSYYDGAWRRLGHVRWTKDRVTDLPRPRNPEGLLCAAKQIPEELPIPFARIDLYESGGEVYLAEITASPGSTQRYSRELDLIMGEAWERAEAILVRRNRNSVPGSNDGHRSPRDS